MNNVYSIFDGKPLPSDIFDFAVENCREYHTPSAGLIDKLMTMHDGEFAGMSLKNLVDHDT